MIAAFVFTILSTTPRALAGDCSNVDLQSQFGSVRDQGDVGWCYAYAYADLVGHALKIKPPDKVSAMDVAVSYASGQDTFAGKRLNDRTGGDFVVAPHTYNQRGRLCLESQIPSEPFQKPSARGFPLPELKEEAFMRLSKMATPPRFDTAEYRWMAEQVQRYYDQLHIKTMDSIAETTSNPMPPCLPPELRVFDIRKLEVVEGLRRRTNDWMATHINAEHDRICSKDERLSRLRTRVVTTAGKNGRRRLVNEANRLLAASRPFEVGYNVGKFLKTPSDSPHASVVVGRRWNSKKKSCEYLVRNSWGVTGCRNIRGDLECKDGQFWADGAELFGPGGQILSIDPAN